MKSYKYVLFVGLLMMLLLTSACSSTRGPGVDRQFLTSLDNKLLFASGLERTTPFPSPAPGISHDDVLKTVHAYPMALYLVKFQDGFQPQLLLDVIDDQSVSWQSAMSADLSFDGDQMAMVAAVRNGTEEICVMKIDSGEWQQITHNSWIKQDPTWSPDGTRIAFSARAKDTNGDGAIDEKDAIEIYTINIDGSNLQQITFNGGHSTDPRWSPNGEWMVYRLRTKREQVHIDGLYLLHLKTGENRELVAGGGIAAPVSWSPDSRFIALAAASGNKEKLWFGTDIYVQDVETGARIKLTDSHQYTPYRSWESGGIHLSNPVWSPDGEAIAFAWTWNDWNKHAVFVMSHDGSRLSQLTDWSECSQIPLSWRP